MIEDPDDSEISPGFLSKFSRNMKGPISCPLRYSSMQMLTTNPEFVSQESARIRKAASFSFQIATLSEQRNSGLVVGIS